MRVVIECRRGESADLILNQLLLSGHPYSVFMVLTWFALIEIVHVVCRSWIFLMPLSSTDVRSSDDAWNLKQLKRENEWLFILEGLAVAIGNLDDVIQMIKSAVVQRKQRLLCWHPDGQWIIFLWSI